MWLRSRLTLASSWVLFTWRLLAGCSEPAAPPDAAQGFTVCEFCNPLVQTGCGPGQRCTFLHDGEGGFVSEHECDNGMSAPACAPAGTLPALAGCEITVGEADDCEAGTLCHQGACRALCGYPTPRCETGMCVLAYPISYYNVCARPCDPTAPDCAPGEACYLPRVEQETPGCVVAGSRAEGALCDYAEQCAAGLTCNPDRVCGQICMDTCPSGQSCEPWAEGAPAGWCRSDT